MWEVLTEFEHYGDWNPFIVEIVGDADSGARLVVRMAPPGGRAATLKPVVTEVAPAEVFEWRGSLPVPGLFSGRHRFELHRVTNGTRFVQSEQFGGALVPLLGRLLKKTTVGFIAMNESLKARAEHAALIDR